MKLLYDQRDWNHAEKHRDLRLRWLREVGAVPIQEASADVEGFLFGYHVPELQYAELVKQYPGVRDRTDERKSLTELDDVLSALGDAGIAITTPRTWRLEVDLALPHDLTFPLFVRTSVSSWKRGGQSSKVRNERQLREECEELRRAFGWDATIMAREWLDIAEAGTWRYGTIPQEVRVWIVDAEPFAWSFHYLSAIKEPIGFPPSDSDLDEIATSAAMIAMPFTARLIAADFAKDRSGQWHFIEASPGACSGIAHEGVFKAIAKRLAGQPHPAIQNKVGGLLV